MRVVSSDVTDFTEHIFEFLNEETIAKHFNFHLIDDTNFDLIRMQSAA